MAETILIADDNEANRLVAEGNLVSSGYAVILAASGAEAIEKFKEHQPDLVLLDIVMPGMDGLETCRRLRALPTGADVPVVFLTALTDLESHRQAVDAGGDDLITKPINRNELLLRTRSMLWMHRLRTELRSGYNLIRSQRDALLRVQKQREELASFIVHDLRNPLSSVHNLAQLLTTDPPPPPQYQRTMAEQIVDATRLMEGMIMNLLDINRSSDGKLVAKPAKIKVEDFVGGLRQLNEPRFAKKKVQLAVDVAKDVSVIYADEDLLRRTIDNLLGNALRFTPQGSSTTVDFKPVDGKTLQIRVRDEGPGIPKEHRERVFDQYVQLDQEMAGHNHGLGLTFCRIAVEAQSGRIWVEDNQPRGASFCIQLPCLESLGG